jgi:hypothetical protein
MGCNALKNKAKTGINMKKAGMIVSGNKKTLPDLHG